MFYPKHRKNSLLPLLSIEICGWIDFVRMIRLPTEVPTLCQEQGRHILRGFSIG
jgi:hypothetical protein